MDGPKSPFRTTLCTYRNPWFQAWREADLRVFWAAPGPWCLWSFTFASQRSKALRSASPPQPRLDRNRGVSWGGTLGFQTPRNAGEKKSAGACKLPKNPEKKGGRRFCCCFCPSPAGLTLPRSWPCFMSLVFPHGLCFPRPSQVSALSTPRVRREAEISGQSRSFHIAGSLLFCCLLLQTACHATSPFGVQVGVNVLFFA